MASKKLKEGLGLNEHKNLESFNDQFGQNTLNPWSYTGVTGNTYTHPYEWIPNMRYFFSMEDVYHNGFDATNGQGYQTPQTYSPPNDCPPSSVCPNGTGCSTSFSQFELAMQRFNCSDDYPMPEGCTMAALSRIFDPVNGVRQFQYKHWDRDEWSSYPIVFPTVTSGMSLPCPNIPLTATHLAEIKQVGIDMGNYLNDSFPLFNQAHLNEFWHNCRDEEYHAFMDGFRSTFNGQSGATSTQDSDPNIGTTLYHNHTSFYENTNDEFVAIHPYSFEDGQQGSGSTLTGKPELMYYNDPNGHAEIADMIEYATAVNKPLYITEIGWNHAQLPFGEAQQSAYSLRAYLLACAKGVEKVFFYWGKDIIDGAFNTTGWLQGNPNQYPNAYQSSLVGEWETKQIYRDFEYLISVLGEHCFDRFIVENVEGIITICLASDSGNISDDVLISWDCNSDDYTNTLQANAGINGMPSITPRTVEIDLNDLLINQDAGGTWEPGTCSTPSTEYVGQELINGVVTVDRCEALAGNYTYTYSHPANEGCTSACTEVTLTINN